MTSPLPGQRALLIAGALAAASAIALAAIASHVFAGVLVGKAAVRFASALQMHLLHAPLLFALALAAPHARLRWWAVGSIAVCTGLLVFCSGLYVAALAGNESLISLVPAGGGSMILGWMVLGMGFAFGDTHAGVTRDELAP